MPEFHLAPCPFCGGPNRAVSPRWSGPARRVRRWSKRLKRMRTRTDWGSLLGYEIACGCGCRLKRTWRGTTTKTAVRRLLAAAWNRRAATDGPGGPEGFRPCPLCGSLDVWPLTECDGADAQPVRPAVECAACGLGWVWPGADRPTLDALRQGWNARQTEAEFRLLQAARYPPVRACEDETADDGEDVLPYGWNELMWHLKQKWDESAWLDRDDGT
jgi:hypothetical protein